MQLIKIENTELSVVINLRGAVLHSVRKANVEYLWQGDTKYWARRDANLFPYVGRLTDGKYTYQGKTYSMPPHGFCMGENFEVTNKGTDWVKLQLRSNTETLKMYPFCFLFEITYRLCNNTIEKKCMVRNLDSKVMYFGIGSHPGFQVPLNQKGKFEDWYLRFPQKCRPYRVMLNTDSYGVDGTVVPYPLEQETDIPLRHDLFDTDAIILREMPRSIALRSDACNHQIRVDFPDMPFLGIWQTGKSDAAFICIEPWASLPSHHRIVEDLQTQQNLVLLHPNQIYTTTIVITLN